MKCRFRTWRDSTAALNRDRMGFTLLSRPELKRFSEKAFYSFVLHRKAEIRRPYFNECRVGNCLRGPEGTTGRNRRAAPEGETQSSDGNRRRVESEAYDLNGKP